MPIGHDRLKNPSPSDIYPGLAPVPPFSKKHAKGLCQGEVIMREGREIRYIGTEHCAFVDENDYNAWCQSLFQSHGFFHGRKVARTDYDKITVDNQHLQWAMGMIWPDQSFVSLRTYRGPRRNYWGSAFHHARLEVLTGGYFNCFLNFIYVSKICLFTFSLMCNVYYIWTNFFWCSQS